MDKKYYLTSAIKREKDGFVSFCPELDIASQGDTVEEAAYNLKEAVGLFLECAEDGEIKRRLPDEIYITHFEASYAT